MKHTMSMYENKDSMIEAMQDNIDSLELSLAEAKKDSERLDLLSTQKYGKDVVTYLNMSVREAIDSGISVTIQMNRSYS